LTASELLVLLGRAWSRLLLYPGGLAPLTIVWLISRTENREPRTPVSSSVLGRVPSGWFSVLALSAAVLPWLGLALLPLPLAVTLSRQTDLVVTLALLEWPLLLTIAQELRDERESTGQAAAQRLAAALNSYPALILATLALAQSGGSFELLALARWPGDLASTSARVLHWAGAVAWALALPPALGLGPFAARPPEQRALRAGLRLRSIGLLAIAALPWLGDREWTGVIVLWLPLPPLLIAAALWAYHRLTAGQSPRRWARAYAVLDVALLLALLWAASMALRARVA
jgi:hypothetical protein